MNSKWGGINSLSNSIYDTLHTRESLEAELRRRVEPLLDALMQCKDKALLAIPSAIGFTQGDLREIANVAKKELDLWRNK